ncbi:CPBP family intramembrane metalloprotease [Salegentibacter sp. JZCK2]|uniref:CPBP family intramembrane glutamic endopeptidase n=1 Tax=Salegentibacter tibetensis TaxID=2873600 RepID=UPI001CCC773D|nr:CPBP family intramembrane glutamic endopeptidase [Salegentibacter tibetensis]MBZ9731316.1 CPBP family intramembrane metalloprotease [Salegentibacter tibetensis]
MYIAEAFKYRHDFWRYIIGTILVVGGVIIGQIPLGVAVFLERGMEIAEMTETEIMQVLDSNLTFFLILLTFAAGLGVLLLVVKLLHNQPIRSLTTSRKKVDWGRVWFGFGLVAAFTVIVTLVEYAVNPEDFLINFQPVPFAILLVIAIIMIPLQTSFEEYLFRGYFMQGLGTLVKNRWLPLIVTSVCFGGLHFFNPEVTQMGNLVMIYYIGTGFLLGIITLMDEGMELALGFHAGNNLVAALLITADWTAFQTESIFKDLSDPTAGLDVLVPVFIIYPLFLFIMAKKYGWSDWKNKLFGKVEKPETLKLSEEG